MSAAGKNGFQAVVIGGGHNGLTAAAYLARAGLRVAVLERRPVLGGIAAGEEFLPGYGTAGLVHDASRVWGRVVKDLDLGGHGLSLTPARPPVLALDDQGRGLRLDPDPAGTAKEIEALASAGEAARYGQYRAFLSRLQGFIVRLLGSLPPDLGSLGRGRQGWDLLRTGLALRRLGKKDMMELARIAPMCLADWLNEWFETDLLKAALAWPALAGDFTGPWSPGTNVNLVLYECASGSTVKGGPRALVRALEKAARAGGAEIRTGAEVERIIFSKGEVKGVALAGGGEVIESPLVLSSCDPRRTFLELLDRAAVDERLALRFENFRGRGTTAKVNLALDAPLKFACRPGRMVEFARTGSSLTQLEKAFDAAKHRRLPERPLLDIHLPHVSDPSLAPAGHAVASILVHFIPFDLDGGWTDQRRRELGDLVVSTLEEYAPGLSESIVGREVLSPADLGERYGLVRGHLNHGEHALDQLFLRPTPECARFATPIRGLYLCGSGGHPGGGITCGPGSLAASVAVKARAELG